MPPAPKCLQGSANTDVALAPPADRHGARHELVPERGSGMHSPFSVKLESDNSWDGRGEGGFGLQMAH